MLDLLLYNIDMAKERPGGREGPYYDIILILYLSYLSSFNIWFNSVLSIKSQELKSTITSTFPKSTPTSQDTLLRNPFLINSSADNLNYYWHVVWAINSHPRPEEEHVKSFC